MWTLSPVSGLHLANEVVVLEAGSTSAVEGLLARILIRASTSLESPAPEHVPQSPESFLI